MKSSALALLLIAASSFTALRAEKENAPRPPVAPVPPAPPAQHGSVQREPRPSEKVSFLGITTMPVSPTLTEQLGLPKGIGLVVTGVVPESPAAGVLKSHDILTKLNDQLLIETHQLAVLVRSFKENEEVTLTYVRAGKEATAKVKLTQRDVPKDAWLKGKMGEHSLSMDMMTSDGDSRLKRDAFVYQNRGREEEMQGLGERIEEARAEADRRRRDAGVARDTARLSREAAKQEADRILSLIGTDVSAGTRTIHATGEGGRNVTIINTRDGNIMLNDGEGMLKLSTENGKRTLLAKNLKGETFFSGAVTTPEERKALPPELRERLEKLENMKGLSFKTDSDFEGGDIRVARPDPHAISLPRLLLPPPATDEAL